MFGRGNRCRWWYRMTGMPGWLGFGYRPMYGQFMPMGYPQQAPMTYPKMTPEDEIRMLEEDEQILEDELKMLEDEKKMHENDLNQVRERIKELKKKNESGRMKGTTKKGGA